MRVFNRPCCFLLQSEVASDQHAYSRYSSVFVLGSFFILAFPVKDPEKWGMVYSAVLIKPLYRNKLLCELNDQI